MIYAVIFASGVGSRMGSLTPKQFLTLGKGTILSYTIREFQLSPSIDKIVVVTLSNYIEKVCKIVECNSYKKVVKVLSGGETAFESQFLGISYLKDTYGISDNDIVLIHDGVRPFLNNDIINLSIRTAQSEGNCIIVSPAPETIAIISKDGKITKTIPRQDCLIARAPQTFYLKDLYSAHLKAKKDKKVYIDSASMFLDQGIKLKPIIGPDENIKITTQYDYMLAKLLVEKNEKNR